MDPLAIDWYGAELPGAAFADAIRALHALGPVARVSAMGGRLPVTSLHGYRVLAEAFRDGERFPPGHAYQIISQPYIGETFMSMDEDRHRVWRPPMTPSFRRSVIDALEEEELVPIGHALVDAIEAEGRADLVPSFTHRFAFAIICHQLGLPRDREAEFYDWSMDLMFGGRDAEKSRRADAALTAYVDPVIDARRAEPRNDVISGWLGTEVAGEPVDREAILAHVRLFFTAGATTTSDALGNLIHALLSHPVAWQACVDDPAVQPDAVQELLRWNPPVASQPRFSRPDREVELEGFALPPSSPVLFAIAAAHRDPEVYRDPDRFDLERRPKDLLTFGPGLRTCPGMHLAQKNLRVGLRVLCERLPRLRLLDSDACAPRNILLRGPATLPATWS